MKIEKIEIHPKMLRVNDSFVVFADYEDIARFHGLHIRKKERRVDYGSRGEDYYWEVVIDRNPMWKPTESQARSYLENYFSHQKIEA